VAEELFLDGVLAEPGDGAQPPGHCGPGPTAGFQFAGEGLDVGTAQIARVCMLADLPEFGDAVLH
jgi:hypothetical protein